MKEYIRKELKRLCVLYDVPMPQIYFLSLKKSRGEHLSNILTLEQTLIFDLDRSNANNIDETIYHEFCHLLQFYMVDSKVLHYWRLFAKLNDDLYVLSAHEISAWVFSKTHDWQTAYSVFVYLEPARSGNKSFKDIVELCNKAAKKYYSSAALP